MSKKSKEDGAGKNTGQKSPLEFSNESPSPSLRDLDDALLRSSNMRPDISSQFSHAMYEKACQVYRHLKGELPAADLPEFIDDTEQRRAYSLAFGTKKYEGVLEDMLVDSYFFSSYFKLEAYHRHRVMVLLFDFQQNGFQFGNTRSRRYLDKMREEDKLPTIEEIQEAMFAHRTKLCAALARDRIKYCAISVDALLPLEDQKKNKYASRHPVYGRVNTTKTSVEEVVATLNGDGMLLVGREEDPTTLVGRAFKVDHDFDDLLVFSRELKFDVYNHYLAQIGHLVMQDKSHCITPYVTQAVLRDLQMQREKAASFIPGEMQKLFGEGDDVILVNPDSGNMSSHLASIISTERILYICGVNSKMKEELQTRYDVLGIKNIKLVEDNFLACLPADERFKKVKVVVCNASCSKSGIVNPVDYVLQEGVGFAKELANKSEGGKVRSLAFEHLSNIKQAMKFSHVQMIVYCTDSVNEVENEGVLTKASEDNRNEVTKSNQPTFEYFPVMYELNRSIQRAAYLSAGLELDMNQKIDDKCFKLQPTPHYNGGFIGVLKKQRPVETAQEVIEKATKKGIVGKEKGPAATRKKSKRPSVAAAPPPAEPKKGDEHLRGFTYR